MTPRFTILVAAYNAERTLGETLDSLLAQTLPEWQAVVVDDGSTDGTYRLAGRFAASDPRIRVFRQANSGTAAARNTAAKHADAPWLLALDADDMLLPESLEHQVAFMDEHPGFDVYSWGMILQAPDGSRAIWRVSAEHPNVESFTLDTLIVENVLPTSSVVSADLFAKAGGFREIFLEDYDFWLRSFAAAATHLHNPEPLELYRVSVSSKNVDFTRRTDDTARIFADLAEDLSATAEQRRRAGRVARMHRALGVRFRLETALDHRDYSRVRPMLLAARHAYPNVVKWLGGVLIMLASPRLFSRVAPRLDIGLANIDIPEDMSLAAPSPPASRSVGAGAETPISVVIVTYNNADVIEDCLRSLLETAPTRGLDVTVVDNASSDGTAAVVTGRFPGVTFVANARNLGFAAGNNEGARMTSGDRLLLLNPDTVVRPGALAALADALDARPDLGIVGAFLVDCSLEPAMSYGEFPTLGWALAQTAPVRRLGVKSRRRVGGVPARSEASHDVDYVSGACLMIRRGLWESLGGLDEEFFAYFEETDLCLRARKAGWCVGFVAEGEVQHLEGASFAGRSVERAVRFHEGLVRFFAKNLGVARTLFLRAWILLVNVALISISTVLGRWLPTIRANRPIQARLIKLAVSPLPKAASRVVR